MKRNSSFLLSLFFVFVVFFSEVSVSGDATCFGYTSASNPFLCYSHGNCVWWAAYRRPDLKGLISGDAVNWYENSRNTGFEVGNRPSISAVAVFSSTANNSYGHVAYVESVSGDGSFKVSEMDYYGSLGTGNGVQYGTYYSDGNNTYHRDNGKKGGWSLLGFIYPKYCLYLNDTEGVFCWNGNNGYFAECLDGNSYTLYKRSGGTLASTQLSGQQGVSYCAKIANGDYPNAKSIDLGMYKGGTVSYAAYGGWSYQTTKDPGNVILNPQPSTPTNLVPHVDVYDQAGTELSADCRTCSVRPVKEGQIVRVKQTNETKDADAKPSLREDFNSVPIATWWRIEDAGRNAITPWKLLFDRNFGLSNMKKGMMYGESTNFTVPNMPGFNIAFATCVDYKDRVKEKGEGSRRPPANSPSECGTDNVSRIERLPILEDPFVSCNAITGSNWVSGGWVGLGYAPPFTPSGTQVVNVFCKANDLHRLKMIIGDPNNPMMISYLTGYVKSKTTREFLPQSLTCSGAVNEGWCQGVSSIDVSDVAIDTTTKTNPTEVYGATCEMVNGVWQCSDWRLGGAGR